MNQVASHGETFELVLGVGALAWQPLGHQAALRHVLTFAVQIEFDDESGLLIGRRSDEGSPVKVELDMLDPSLITAHVNNLRSEAKIMMDILCIRIICIMNWHGLPMD